MPAVLMALPHQSSFSLRGRGFVVFSAILVEVIALCGAGRSSGLRPGAQGGGCPAPLDAVRPCAPAGLSHRAGGAAIAAGEGWSPAGGSRGGALQRCRGHKAVYISYPPKELVGY